MATKIIKPTRIRKHADLKRDLSAMGMSFKDAENMLLKASNTAYSMATRSYDEIEKIKSEKGKDRIDAFNNNVLLRKWFGEIESKGQVRNMISRFNTIKKRLKNGVKIRLRPNNERSSNARNMGTFTSPKRFKVYARLLNSDTKVIASVLIHELMHEWFTDKKLANGNDVDDATTALQLVNESSGKARRSPENFEQYCLEV